MRLFTEILALIFLRLAMSINSDQVMSATTLALRAAGCTVTWPAPTPRQHEETAR